MADKQKSTILTFSKVLGVLWFISAMAGAFVSVATMDLFFNRWTFRQGVMGSVLVLAIVLTLYLVGKRELTDGE